MNIARDVAPMTDAADVDAVLFDFSGTLFRLEERAEWFAGMTVGGDAVDGRVQAELMRRLTAPTGASVTMDADAEHAWRSRDLHPSWHRRAYLHVLRESGVTDEQAATLYARMVEPSNWTPYPDTALTLAALRRRGIGTAVVSNIAFDLRPAFAALGLGGRVDAFVLSFEVGVVKPDPAIFAAALARLGADPARTLMVGDSEEADGGARALGCRFALVDPAPTALRPDGLITALARHGIDVDAGAAGAG